MRDTGTGSYALRQRQRDGEYRRGYEAWIASLSPEERRQAKALGLDAPFLPGAASGMSDAATSTRARCEAAEIEEPDDNDALDERHEEIAQQEEPAPANEITPGPSEERRMCRLLRRLIGELMSQSDAKLSMECLSLVTGLTYDGDSMTRIASKYGVTRAAVSKRCVELTQALNLNPSRAMRSRKARSSYRSSRTSHLRHTA